MKGYYEIRKKKVRSVRSFQSHVKYYTRQRDGNIRNWNLVFRNSYMSLKGYYETRKTEFESKRTVPLNYKLIIINYKRQVNGKTRGSNVTLRT